MIPMVVLCNRCGSENEVRTFRKFVKCNYCDNKIPFEGFDYREINWNDSMYKSVKRWTDCPACRSPNMYLGPEKRAWKCPDCGYIWTRDEQKHGVLWFCDECEAYLNIQPGFINNGRTWQCSECGHLNDISENNII